MTTAKPTITSFSPMSGPVGTLVTINGTNFTGATAVKFAGTTAPFTVNSNTRIGATVPAGASTGRISVTTPGGTATSSKPFTVTGVRHPRGISLHLRRHLRVSGSVAVLDGFSACRANVPVKIQRHRLGIGNWRTILRLSTDASGAFAAHVPNRSGRYRARAVRVELVSGDICLRASSGAHRYVS
ncbi:MAG TPA: IPT/TIG domain-containing protein [Acidimicrobiia bacterium]|nr:IPT/TIG domain-containing protein [Acidimicrobiia bacterium]